MTSDAAAARDHRDGGAKDDQAPAYGTWIRLRRLYLLAAIDALLVLAGAVLTPISAWFAILFVAAIPIGYVVAILALTVWRLGLRGGDFQRRVHALVVANAAPGETRHGLDIGCGSGALTVRLATAAPEATVIGVDFWGQDWEYSKDQCERNARLAGVAGRASFRKQTAAALEFPDGTFDTVVSCLTFHEVRDVAEKNDVITEALRVLRPGGRYAFLDLFADPGHFGSLGRVRATIAAAGAAVDTIGPLTSHLHLPFPLSGRRVLGNAVLIAGTKAPAG